MTKLNLLSGATIRWKTIGNSPLLGGVFDETDAFFFFFFFLVGYQNVESEAIWKYKQHLEQDDKTLDEVVVVELWYAEKEA